MSTYRIRHIRHRLTWTNPETDKWETRPEETLHTEEHPTKPAALRAFEVYLVNWEAADPENRHVNRDGHIKAALYERPAGCACRTCAPGGWAEERGEPWHKWGAAILPHEATYARIDRLGEVVARAKAPTWALCARDPKLPEQAPTIISRHMTKRAARRALTDSAYVWRGRQRHQTASLDGPDAYLLKWRTVPQTRISVEPITP